MPGLAGTTVQTLAYSDGNLYAGTRFYGKSFSFYG